MKKLSLALWSILFLSACQPAAEPPAAAAPVVDKQQIETEAKAFTNSWRAAMKAGDMTALSNMIAGDALICGTDPGELMTKEQAMAQLEQFPPGLDISPDTHRIRVADDGQSVLIVEQLKLDLISPYVPIRWTYHLVKSGDQWVMDFSNVALIPLNEDLPRINGAYEEGS